MSNKDNDNVKDEPLPMKRPPNWIEAPKPPIKAKIKKKGNKNG